MKKIFKHSHVLAIISLMVLTFVITGCVKSAKITEEPMAEDKATMEEPMAEDKATMEEPMADDKAAMEESMTEDKATMEEPMAEDKAAMEEPMADDKAAMDAPMMTNEGSMAPEFEFVDADGNVYNNETFKGQKVYLKYWASWCPICLSGLPDLDTLFVEAEGYTIYTVVTPNANGEQSQSDFIEWFNGLDQKNIKVLFDTKGQAAREFGVRAFPTSIFIGSDGVLVQTVPGHKTNEDIEAFINTFY